MAWAKQQKGEMAMFLTALIMASVITIIMTVGRFLGEKTASVSSMLIGAVVGFIVNLIFVWLYLWFVLPAMTGWLGGYFALIVPLVLNVVLAFIIAGLGSDNYGSGNNGAFSSAMAGLVVSVILLLAWFAAIIYPVYGATALRNIPQITESKEKIEEVSVEHIRLIPQETASWLGDKALGQGNTGAQFQVGEFEIQRIRGKLYWAAPLEFRDFFKWLDAKVTPGYVLVSAEENSQQAELRLGYELRYVPSSPFGSNLHRYLYENGWSNLVIQEPTFEVDEEMKPWWVVTVGHPTVGLGGETVDGVVLLDPENGKMQYYPLGQTPEWIDRVIPLHTALEYNNWWGKYINGFWNTVFGQRDVQQTTDIDSVQDAFLVYGRGNQAHWFTGFTSPTLKDASLTGYSMMNSVTGETLFYGVSGFGHEGAAVEAVNAAVANFKGWHGAQPIFYNIYGRETWVIPVLSETKILQKVAIVEAATMKVVLGNTKQEALAAYQIWLEEKGSGRAPTQTNLLKEVEGRVLRIAANVEEGRTVFYFILDTAPDRIFRANSSVSDKLVLTQVGDRVQVMFADTETRAVTVSKFGNLDVLPSVDVVPQIPATIETPEAGFYDKKAPTAVPTPTPTATPTPTPKKYSD